LDQQRISNSRLQSSPGTDEEFDSDEDSSISDSDREYQLLNTKKHHSSPNRVHQIRFKLQRHSDRPEPTENQNYIIISPSHFPDLEENMGDNIIMDEIDEYDEEIYNMYSSFGNNTLDEELPYDYLEDRCPAPDPYSTLCRTIMIESSE